MRPGSANDRFQTAESRQAARDILEQCSYRLLLGIADLNYVDTHLSRATMVYALLESRWPSETASSSYRWETEYE